MTYSESLSQRSPEEIESRIAHTRKSLDRKLERLEERLDPQVRLNELKAGVYHRVDTVRSGLSSRAPQLLAWGAVGAVVAGSALAISGWRKLQNGFDEEFACGCVADLADYSFDLPNAADIRAD